MTETLFLVDGHMYDHVEPVIRRYESALAQYYKGVQSGGVGAEDHRRLYQQLVDMVSEQGEAALSVTPEMSQAAAEAVRRLAADEAADLNSLKRLSQAVGLSPEEAGLLGRELAAFGGGALQALIEVYERAFREHKGVIILIEN